MFDRAILEDNSWRWLISSYGHVMSRGRWFPYKWHKYMLARIQKSLLKGNARLIVCAPPRHGKSEAISHWVPTWYLDWNPDKRVIATSHGESLALEFADKVREDFINNELTWTRIRKERARIDDWKTIEGGGMRSTGITGSITGRGADLLLIDDPHKDEFSVTSETQRKRVLDAFSGTLYNRLHDNGSIIVIQTRWHERDLAGYLIDEHKDDWEIINLPAMAEKNDVLGRKENEPLCPELISRDHLLRQKRSAGPYRWASLFQQRPAPIEGGIIKRNWINYYDELPEELEDWIQGWDLTFSDTGESFVVGQVWARRGANVYLIDQIRDKLDFPSSIKAIRRMSRRWPLALNKLVEDKANGPAVLSTLRNEISGMLPYKPKGSKVARLSAVSGFFEAGNVWIPRKAEWTNDYVEEITVFPNALTDDQADTTSMCLKRFEGVCVYDIKLNLLDGHRTSPWEFENAS